MLMFSKFTANDAQILKLDGAPTESFCSDGIVSGNVCCASSCGACGGTGCDGFPGGAENCCSGAITDNNKVCEDVSDVGCVIDVSKENLLKSWAVQDKGNSKRVLIINKNVDDTSSQTVKIVVKNEQIKSQAMLHRLNGIAGDGLDALYNISLASQTYDGSTDGTIVGQEHLESVMPFLTSDGSSFTFNVGPAQAVMLDIVQ